MRNFFKIIPFFFFFLSCVKDKPEPVLPVDVQMSEAKKVYVINEGGFGYGNASVSLYDPGNGQVIEDLFKTQNKADLGDVAQSLYSAAGRFYIVVNNSNKIVVCDQNFKKTGQINGLGSPRYMQQVTNQKAYVSDYNSNAISVIDLNTLAKTGVIPVTGWTEKMVMIYNKVFVANIRRNFVYIINTLNDAITDSVEVGINAASLVLDKHDKVWVLSAGDKSNSVPGRLSKINALTGEVEFFARFNPAASPSHLCLNRTKDTLYFLDKGVFRMSVNQTVLPALPFIENGNKNFYGLGINPNDYTIYVADALDYSQKSNVYIYTPSGEQSKFFKAGVNANGFYFE